MFPVALFGWLTVDACSTSNLRPNPQQTKIKQETVIPWESSRFWTASRCKKIELQILMLFRPNESCKRHVSVARFRSAFLELHIFAVFVRLGAAQYMLQQKISSLFSFLSQENKRK